MQAVRRRRRGPALALGGYIVSSSKNAASSWYATRAEHQSGALEHGDELLAVDELDGGTPLRGCGAASWVCMKDTRAPRRMP